jgi:hypothetical protein
MSEFHSVHEPEKSNSSDLAILILTRRSRQEISLDLGQGLRKMQPILELHASSLREVHH